MTFLGPNDDLEIHIKISWRTFTFTSLLYAFNFLGLVHIVIDNDKPINFDLIASWGYRIWVIVGFVSPLLFIMSMLMMFRANGKIRLMGIWLRFAANIGLFTCILAFWVAGWDMQSKNETYTYAGYLVTSILFYLFFILIKDLYILFRIYEDAKRIGLTRKDN